MNNSGKPPPEKIWRGKAKCAGRHTEQAAERLAGGMQARGRSTNRGEGEGGKQELRGGLWNAVKFSTCYNAYSIRTGTPTGWNMQ
jgi:hypothetical protein